VRRRVWSWIRRRLWTMQRRTLRKDWRCCKVCLQSEVWMRAAGVLCHHFALTIDDGKSIVSATTATGERLCFVPIVFPNLSRIWRKRKGLFETTLRQSGMGFRKHLFSADLQKLGSIMSAVLSSPTTSSFLAQCAYFEAVSAGGSA